jgi:hypothetical protein
MERIDELLDKYFRGETTLAEEKLLKNYFASGDMVSEHESYRDFFRAFELESKEKMSDPLKKVLPVQKFSKRLWIRTFSYSGIAAAILLTLWIQRPQQSENYAIVAGNRIDDPEYVQKYAEKKLNKVNEILKNSMEPMNSVKTVRRSLQPMEKIAETRKKLEEIESNIQFK